MKLKHIIEAKDAIVRLTEKRFTDYKKLREIVRLRKQVEAEFEFYCEQEKKAVDTYGEKSDKGTPAFLPDGRLKLKDIASKEAFEQEIAKLRDTEVGDFVIITIKESDFLSADDLPTPSDMFLLENIINFVD